MRRNILKLIIPVILFALEGCVGKAEKQTIDTRTISTELLKDKIAGGWAGKMIGVTYGAPTEFKAQGKLFEDSIKWVPADVKGSLWQDDLYVQLTFLMTMDQFGIDAPAKKFQELFARAGYKLWAANVQARKNYFDSIFPPQSGHPDNNIHADDIDFQIEADYIGFMCPGMPLTAKKIADKIGHIMNWGDGVYGGIFIGALYSEAFFENNIHKLIEKALLSIPAESDYSKIVKDVMILHNHYPKDWRAAWKELNAKWGSDHIWRAGTDFNIEAKFNGAFVIMGLLYGDGDMEKTMEISTRCGQDSDCNPSNAMAVLGVIKGFRGLPESYRNAVQTIGDSIFINTNYSFNKAMSQTLKYAKELTSQNGGTVTANELKIKVQAPQPFSPETSFPKLIFDHQVNVFAKGGWEFKGKWKTYKQKDQPQAVFSSNAGDEAVFNFEGTGISITGSWFKDCGKADIWVDGKLKRTVDCYFDYANQTHTDVDIYHVNNLEPGKHTLKLSVKGEKRLEAQAANVYLSQAIVFKTKAKKSENYKFSFQR